MIGAAPATRRRTRTLCVLFFFSGFPALVYQLVWQRELFHIFGIQVESVTVVVTAFMLGLGAGSLVGGWLSTRSALPLLPLIAAIELLTAAFGVASPRLFERVGAGVLGASLPTTALLTLALVVVPTLLMGATLPVLVGHLVRRTSDVGGSVGVLYHANTLGAAAACLVCAAVLFPFLGMRGSLRFAAAVNVAVALGAVVAYARERRPAARGAERLTRLEPPVPSTTAPRAPTGATGWLGFPAALGLSSLGGFVSLSYEIFFFRTVSYATGSSAPAFALTLGAFLAGLASGARWAARSCAAGPEGAARHALARLLAANVIGALFLPVLSQAGRLPSTLAVPAAALVLVYAVAATWGGLLPALAHLGVHADGDAGMRTALVYVANIVGSATGSVVTGFVLTDLFGLVVVQALLVAAGLACAALLSAALSATWRPRRLRAAAAVTLCVLACSSARPATATLLERLMWKRGSIATPPFRDVVENRSGIVTVDAAGAVFGNGLYDGRFNVDLVRDTNGIVRPYALGLFHPAPREVLMIGLSSGSWAQVVANHPDVSSLTVVEINPGYLGLVARDAAVASLLSNPKVSIEVDDGRRWLRAHPDRKFDAIVSNTTWHYRSNASSLLSAEFLALVRRHLRDGGIFLYNTTGSDRVQRTGCLAFPHGLRFRNQLVVSASPIEPDFGRWRGTLARYRIDGHPVLDAAREADRRTLESLVELEREPPGVAPAARHLESCREVLARTAGLEPVTDDNMGTEWRFVFRRE